MSAGIGMRGRAATLSSLGRTPSRKMTWPKSWTRAAPIEFYSEKVPICEGVKRARKKARVATFLMGESSDPIASSRGIWIMSRVVVTRSITQTKQAGTLAAPWGIRSHSLSSLGVQKELRG